MISLLYRYYNLHVIEEKSWNPNADVYRTREGWTVKFDLAGVRPLAGAQGVSLLSPCDRTVLASAQPESYGSWVFAMRDERYKLLFRPRDVRTMSPCCRR